MKKIGDFVCKQKWLIIIISCLLLIPSLIGMYKTRVNYDILVYLPKDIETLKGENILTDDFKMGAFSVAIVDNMADKDLLKLEEKIRNVDDVNKVISIDDITGTSIPLEFLPSDIINKVTHDDSKLMLITFNDSTSDDNTLAAVEEIRNITKDTCKIGGMSAMVLDTKELFNSEMALYVFIAVVLCILVLMLSLDSYLVPFLLIANIGVAILFNMGTNIFFGDICYITKAISSVLQLGVTTDFSIFLYHKYEKAKKENKDKNRAMAIAIHDTLVSVFGSSLTTIAGFLALCTMNLTLGTDIGLVMAKGVLFGLICVITLFPSLLLVCDKWIEKTGHKVLLPKFTKIKSFVLKNYRIIFIVFLLLLFPAYKAQSKAEVYYNLDKSIPDNYGYTIASKALKEDYNIVSQEIILVDANIKDATLNAMTNEIKYLEGIDLVLSPSELSEYGLSEDILSDDIKSVYETDKYKMVLINSTYDIATDELNNQISEVNKIVDKYDKKAIVAGEGPLMKDLVEITDTDFHNVNFTSIAVIFILMVIVLKSISLPILLVSAIELAIFINMGIPYFTGTQIPFIASVVIGTIQLGATIDYAILMTTKYLEERKNNTPKKEAVKIALDNSVSSIFVSGMCFFAATIGVGIVSKIDMIGSLCTLIARGAIISMLVVIMIVPSLLIIFDKVICKTTLGFKNKKERVDNMKNSKIKKNAKNLAIWSMIGIMSLSTMPVYALTKDETVYSKLNADGSKNYTIVTEHITNDDKKDTIKDETNLKDIINTNGSEEYKLDGNNITWSANKKDIYYKGNTEKELPVSLNVTYKLNEKEISAKDLIGKSGTVEITLNYKNNDKHLVNINGKSTTMYTPFVVTVGATLDSTKVSNVKVSNGKAISNGKSYVIAAIASPGLYESLDISSLKEMDKITIKFDTTDFELSSIYSAVTAKLLDSSDLDVFDNLDSLYSKVDTLSSSSNQLVDGTKKVSDGAKEIRSAVVNAINELKNNNESLDEKTLIAIKAQAVKEATDKVKANEESIKNQAIKQVEDLENATHQIKNASDAGVDANTELLGALKLAAHEQMKATEQGLAAYNACQSGVESYCAYVTSAEQTAINDAKIKFYQNAMNLAKQTAANTAFETAKQTAEQTASEVSTGVATKVATAVKSTVINKVVTSMNALVGGLDSLIDGATTVSDGMKQFNDEGIQTIASFVNNDVKNSSTKVKQLVKLADSYDTFTLKSDETKGTTKFVLVIDGIKKETPKTTTTKKVEKESFWTKIVNLFK